TCRVSSVSRHDTISTPPTDVPCGTLRIVSLAANAYQLPLGLRCDRCSAASMIAGSASLYVGRWLAHCSRGSILNGDVFAHFAAHPPSLLMTPAASAAGRATAGQA